MLHEILYLCWYLNNDCRKFIPPYIQINYILTSTTFLYNIVQITLSKKVKLQCDKKSLYIPSQKTLMRQTQLLHCMLKFYIE